MSEQATQTAGEELQFDRVVAEASPDAPAPPEGLICSSCQAGVTTAYYQVNGRPVCRSCRATLHTAAETPQGAGPLLLAGLFGAGAGIAGAAIYYAVIAIANLEIGIVAILIGYMVGYAVRKGAGGRGGRRFQVLAALLTYASVAFAYTPLAIHQVMKSDRVSRRPAEVEDAGTAATTDENQVRPLVATLAAGRLLLTATMVLGFVLVLPVLVVVGSFPTGLISAFIIFIGMRQAWRMTGALSLEILGPYRVGAPRAPAAS